MFMSKVCSLVVVGCLVGQIWAAVLPTPVITPAPQPAEDGGIRQMDERQVDAVSLAQAMLTALPFSLRLIAATNVPAVSSILWGEFLDDNKPKWFLDLPWDVQSYLITEFGPETAWPTASPSTEATATDTSSSSTTLSSGSLIPILSLTASSSISSFSATSLLTTSQPLNTVSSTRAPDSSSPPNSAAISDPEAPYSSNAGLQKTQKIGIGVGVPLAILAIVALSLACCLLLRRRKRRQVNGTEAPSSPGFIPRFSFQDRSQGYEHHDHRAPLNPVFNHPTQTGDTSWEDDDYEGTVITASPRRDVSPLAAPSMAMQHATPIMAPALFHTHSSNRARGKRTSYTSLHAVAKVVEPEDNMTGFSTPTRRHPQSMTGPPRSNLPRIAAMPPPAAVEFVKRKPEPFSPTKTREADTTAQSFPRPTLAPIQGSHSSSSSSGFAASSLSSQSGQSCQSEEHPISPSPHQAPGNPFAGGYQYLEDYGPEYSNDGYREDRNRRHNGIHGSYVEPASPSLGSKTEWPLRNTIYGRDMSPMWDRVYER